MPAPGEHKPQHAAHMNSEFIVEGGATEPVQPYIRWAWAIGHDGCAIPAQQCCDTAQSRDALKCASSPCIRTAAGRRGPCQCTSHSSTAKATALPWRGRKSEPAMHPQRNIDVASRCRAARARLAATFALGTSAGSAIAELTPALDCVLARWRNPAFAMTGCHSCAPS